MEPPRPTDSPEARKAEFLNNVAHELRTPLAGIYGFSELLLKKPMPEAKQRELIGHIYRQAGRMRHLIDELLDFARIEAGQGLSFHPAPVMLSAIVEDTLDGFRWEDDPREVAWIPDEADSLVLADLGKTRHALLNLLSNAFKYSRGQGEIRIRALRRLHEPSVGLCVEDEGMGMSPEQLARLFERFYRADSAVGIAGTGLGMGLVKQLVEGQQGEVTVESALGRGTRVAIWLPALKSDRLG